MSQIVTNKQVDEHNKALRDMINMRIKQEEKTREIIKEKYPEYA